MRTFVFFFLMMTAFVLTFGCSYGDSNKLMNLDGSWKMVDARTEDLMDNYQDLVKKQMGELATVHSGVLEVKLLDRFFKCEISQPPEMMEKEKCDFYNQQDQGSLKLKDFDFSDRVFVFKTRSVDGNNAFYEIVLDSNGEKMILGADSGSFLFVRQKKKKMRRVSNSTSLKKVNK